MRIWDISPGYLNRESLLGEHRELHGIVSIYINNKRGYTSHPETKRWKECLPALYMRHILLVEEMRLRGYKHESPLPVSLFKGENFTIDWPPYLDSPARQFDILREKYKHKKEKGRIPLPKHAQILWAQHKYSVLARDPNLYSMLGKRAVQAFDENSFIEFAEILTNLLRTPPTIGGVWNALEHIWGYVSEIATREEKEKAFTGEEMLLEVIVDILKRSHNEYLFQQTALVDIAAWMRIKKEIFMNKNNHEKA
jgi:uncharacterized protein YbgA (DUF1722 family)